ncbi:hypothetical protein JT459_000812 [Salmonella enterica]|nr:hypothetical protein [Salmonella enterica]
MEIRSAGDFEWVRKSNAAQTPEEFQKRVMEVCEDTGYTFNGFVLPWNGNKTKLALSCPKHGEWYSTSTQKFLMKKDRRGCPKCGSENYTRVRRLSNDVVMRAINESCVKMKVEFLGFVGGEYAGNKTKLILRCKKHDYIFQNTSFIGFTSGESSYCCRMCDIERKRTTFAVPENVVVDKINNRCKELNYKFLGFVNGYTNKSSKLHLHCVTHNVEWKTTSVEKFMCGRSGCHMCKTTGYKTTKPGYIYVQRVSGVVDAIKFGITNLFPEERLKQQQRRSKLKHELVFCWKFEDGHCAYEIESQIKQKWRDHIGFVDRSIMEDGFTETLPVEILPHFLKEVKSLCNLVR